MSVVPTRIFSRLWAPKEQQVYRCVGSPIFLSNPYCHVAVKTMWVHSRNHPIFWGWTIINDIRFRWNGSLFPRTTGVLPCFTAAVTRISCTPSSTPPIDEWVDERPTELKSPARMSGWRKYVGDLQKWWPQNHPNMFFLISMAKSIVHNGSGASPMVGSTSPWSKDWTKRSMKLRKGHEWGQNQDQSWWAVQYECQIRAAYSFEVVHLFVYLFAMINTGKTITTDIHM